MKAIIYSILLYFWKKKIFLTSFIISLCWLTILSFLSTLMLQNGYQIILDWTAVLLDFLFFMIIFIFWARFFTKKQKWINNFLWSKKLNINYIFVGNVLGFTISRTIILIIYSILLIVFSKILGTNININQISIFFIARFFKYTLLISLIGFFSTFSSFFITIFVTISIYFIWNSSSFLKRYVNQIDTDIITKKLIDISYYVFPNFDFINNIHNLIKYWINYNNIINFWLYSIIFIIIGSYIYSKQRKI